MMASRWNILWTIPWGLASWLAVEMGIFLPVFLVGLVLFWPLLWLCPIVQKESTINVGQPVSAFKWGWANELWGNHEDGLNPDWWAAKGGTPWTWYLRNPVCNMRFWPIVSTFPSASVRWIGNVAAVPPDGTPGWFLAWQGGYVGFRWQCVSCGVWLGWKLNPKDAAVTPSDYRIHGLGTACQLMRFHQ